EGDLPDMGFLTVTEMTCIASMVASAVEIPIIADADDGYGNALSAMRTSLERTKAGHPTESHHVMARVRHFQELERKYILGGAARIQSPDGFGEAAQGTERGVMRSDTARMYIDWRVGARPRRRDLRRRRSARELGCRVGKGCRAYGGATGSAA